MKKIMKWLAESFSPKMNAFCSKPWLAGVSSAMQKIIPFILTSAIISLYNIVRQYVPSLPNLGPITDFSFGLISLIIAFIIGQQLMEKLGKPFYTTNCGLASMAVFFMFIMPKFEDGNMIIASVRLGGAGIAVGMFAGIFTSIIFNLVSKLHLLENNSSIPDFIVGWINTIIPVFIALLLSMILTMHLNLNIFEIVIMIFSPISNFAQTLPGFMLLCTVPAIFYSMGISSWFFGAITTPIYIAALQQNIDAVAAGGDPVNIATGVTVFTTALVTMGGMGATLGLNLLMLFSKSKKLKALGRIFIAPSLFNINEPVVYGTPIVFNPILMVPMWIATMVGSIFVYVIMSIGWLNIPANNLAVGTIPIPLGAYLGTNDFRGILWAFVLLAIYIVIWYPFFKIYEKQCIEEETIIVEN